MTFNFQIAIPSFKRCSILPLKTLKLLKDFKVPNKKILIFLRDEEELKQYQLFCGKNYNFHLHGQTGIDATRNYLRHYYHTETNFDGVLFIDDDLTNLTDMGKDIDRPFMKLVEYFFMETQKLNLRLWSVNATSNYFFMRDKITTNLKYCIGAFAGLILDKSKPIILCDVGHFEDFQFTCEHFIADGGVVRFERYGITTKYFELVGGICGQLGGLTERQKEMKINNAYMLNRYGDMVKIKMKKWGFDLRLNTRYKND
tara:strand:+ start:1644 stop:2414 length:771 start_codon:yes stop_codon:yes gene_type:complete